MNDNYYQQNQTVGSQPMPGQMQGQMYGQPMPGQMQGQMYGQPMPGQMQGQMYGQPMPGQMQGQMYGQPMPGQMQGQMYGQPMPGQMQGQAYGQPMPGSYGIQAPPVPFQGLQGKEEVKTVVVHNPIFEQHVMGLMSSPFMLAIAIITSVQVVSIIASSVLGVGISGASFLLPYLLIAIAAWVTWGGAKAGKAFTAGTVLLKISSIYGMVALNGGIGFFLIIVLAFTVADDGAGLFFDQVVYQFFGIHSSMKTFGIASGLVLTACVMIPAVFYVIMQIKMMVASSVINNIKNKKLGKLPKTKFTAVLMFLCALASVAAFVAYIYVISRALIRPGFICVCISLFLNIGLCGLSGYILLSLGKAPEEDDY